MQENDRQFRVLSKFYDRSTDKPFHLKPEDLNFPIEKNELYAICHQLSDMGFLDFVPVIIQGGTVGGIGKITATGIAHVESRTKSNTVMSLQAAIAKAHQDSRSKIQVSEAEPQQQSSSRTEDRTDRVVLALQHIINEINRMDINPDQKKEVKQQLKTFLDHPSVTSLIGDSRHNIIVS